MISITIGIDWTESLPSLGKVRLFVYDMEMDDDVFIKRLW